MNENETNNEEKQRGIPLAVPTYEDDGGKKGVWIAFFILAFIGLMLIIFVMGEDDKPANNGKTEATSVQPEPLKRNCADEFGNPKERYCKEAMKGQGLDVSKIKNWGGSSNGECGFVCTFSYMGEIYAFDVVFDNHCNAISVKPF